MSTQNFPSIHPSAFKVYGFDWSKRLPAGVTISGATVTAGNGTTSNVTVLNSNTLVAFKYTPAVVGEDKITAIVDWSDGQRDVDTAKIQVDSNV